MTEKPPYNPLDKLNLAISVRDALLEQPIHPLPPKEIFNGAGIYAIYYTGTFPPYKVISEGNRNKLFKTPIYVGKAVPAGARKGGLNLDPNIVGSMLHKRLSEHAESIKSASNLDIKDFSCRFLTVDDIWIPLGETLLIETYSPLWNVVVDGFGNHDPGSGRHKQKRSSWDVIHPGRPWAAKLQPNPKTYDELVRVVQESLKQKK